MRVQPNFFLVLTIVVFSCQSKDHVDVDIYPSQFGEIPFDSTSDNPAFKLCNETDLVHSRTSLSYVGGRQRIEEILREAFENHNNTYEYNGYVLVRFLVNCQGKAGRLRFESMDEGFVKQKSPDGLVALIRKSIETLNEWTIVTPANEGKDHSKYLNLKIKNGQIDAIIH